MNKKFTKIFTTDESRFRITATAKLTDYFSLTGAIDEAVNGFWRERSGGCIHDEIAEHFPELRPYIKWHLVSKKQPMHYIADTLFLAGDKDCLGLRKGETRQIVNGRTGLPSWRRMANINGELVELHKLDKYLDSAERPTETVTLTWEPWGRVGEGKDRELDAARATAVWPDATDEELMAPDLKQKLEARLPALMQEFERDMKSLFEAASLETL
jgi:hypothetical protein